MFLLEQTQHLHRDQKRKLQEFDDEDTTSLAEASRPRRELKQDIKDQKRNAHTKGRKSTKIHTQAQRMNWCQPLIWAQIEAAARRAGKPWNLVDIVQTAKHANPQLFQTLTPQVVGRWVDEEARRRGEYKWKASILEKVKCGNAPGGSNTRRGILVSSKSP